MKNLYLLIFLVLNFTVASFIVAQSSKSINITEFKKELKNDKSIVVLDVRSADELSGPLGQIEGSINIPLQELEKRIHELDKYKNSDIRVISRSGIPSKLATEILIKHGFKAANVEGGIMAYRNVK